MMKLRGMGLALVVLAVGAGWCGMPGQARGAMIFSLSQVGADVLVTASGSLNVATLDLIGDTDDREVTVFPNDPSILQADGAFTVYAASFTGPSGGFGPGGATSPDSWTVTGSNLGFFGGEGGVAVPVGYVSGSPLGTTFTMRNQMLAGMGVTTGSYTWTLQDDSGRTVDSITVNIPVFDSLPVPEPACAALLALGLLGLGAARSRQPRAG